MKNKTTVILGAVFLVLVVAYLVIYMNPKDVSRGAFPIFEVRPDVDKIEFKNVKRGSIVLERTDGTWFITNPIQEKAYDPEVNQLLKFLFETEVDGVVTSRVDARDNYSVGDSTGTNLILFSGGKQVFEAVVGRQSIEVGHTYARRNGSSDIELWRGMMSQEVIRTANNWRDKTVFSYNGSDVTLIEVAEGKQKRVMTLSDSTWTFSDNGSVMEIDQNRSKMLVDAIANLNCDDFGSDSDKERTSSTKPDLRISFKVRNGDSHYVDVWKPVTPTGNYLMMKEKSDLVYSVASNRGDILILNYDKMKPGSGQPRQ
jgi:hypothetical protein